jgi:hypothetical protein
MSILERSSLRDDRRPKRQQHREERLLQRQKANLGCAGGHHAKDRGLHDARADPDLYLMRAMSMGCSELELFLVLRNHDKIMPVL